MGQEDGSNHSRKGKHLNWEERIQIETLWREGFSSGDIGRRLGRPERTIRREIKRGWWAQFLECGATLIANGAMSYSFF